MTAYIERRAIFRDAIDSFLKERLDARLDKHQLDEARRADLVAQYSRETWLADAARQVARIQIVTHTLKAIHPDARGTNLFRAPHELPAHREVGSHALGLNFSSDVVCNAAALGVVKLLKLQVDGDTLLAWMHNRDPDLRAALSDDARKAGEWIDAFIGKTAPRSVTPSSHTLAKQLYWLSGDDPADDTHFHLLAPLYSSSLAHAVFQTIREDLFGEAGTLAREARRAHRDHETGYHQYPELAVQKLGGAQPQNISQLNNERRGNNYLLASRPPSWRARAVKAPLFTDSVFPRFGRIPEVRHAVRALRAFLESNPPPSKETRNRRDGLIDQLIDELSAFAHPLHSILPAGWTRDADCQLVEAERLWLDPGRAATEDAFDADFHVVWHRMAWPGEVGRRFGNWLNHELGQTLPLGDIEGRHWRDELLLHTSWAGMIDKLRSQRDGPSHASRRKVGT